MDENYKCIYCSVFRLQHPVKYLFPLLRFLQMSAVDHVTQPSVASVSHYQRWVLMGGCFAWQTLCSVAAFNASKRPLSAPATHINTFSPF